jgi:hypothetical protein
LVASLDRSGRAYFHYFLLIFGFAPNPEFEKVMEEWRVIQDLLPF